MSRLAMIVTSKTQPGKRDELFRLYQDHLAPRADQNQSQEVVVWAADQHDPDTFHLFEVYSDAAAMGANATADWFGAYMQAAMPLLAGEPRVSMAEPLWSKGLPS
jgi:quinol monooxygenase YgiN